MPPALKLLKLVLVTVAAAQQPPPRPGMYNIAARIEAPADISFPGGSVIGRRCRAALDDGFGGAAAPRREVSREELLAALPTVGAAGWGRGPAAVYAVGELFGANSSAVLRWLEQLHPGARPSRYHPLDPDVRNSKTAVGTLAEESAEHLLFLFRIHAEFKVSSSPALFVMPGCFEATLRVSRDLDAILGFDVQVPTERTFNVLLECGDPFAALGDRVDEAPSSPDARRLSEFKIPFMRREPRDWESVAGQSDTQADGDCEWGKAAESGAIDDGEEEAGGSGREPLREAAAGARSSRAEESAASQGVDMTEGRGEERRASAVEIQGASAKMGLQFFPGEDADFFDEGADATAASEAGSREFFLSLQTATQEVHYPAITLSLNLGGSPAYDPLSKDVAGGSRGGQGHAAEQQGKSEASADSRARMRAHTATHSHAHPILASKLGMALYPFLDAGYTTDYYKAYGEATAVGKPLFAVVLWGALDDASC